MLGGIFLIDVGDFTCLTGEREKKCPGGRLPLNAGELEALLPAPNNTAVHIKIMSIRNITYIRYATAHSEPL